MNRLTLNLARHPAENLRRVRVVWGGSLAVLVLLLVVLSGVAAAGWWSSRPIQAQTQALRAQMAPLLAQQSASRSMLAEPQVRQALQQSAFFNRLIDRKAVSWTLLFEQLERILPPGVELVSLRPLVRDGAQAVDVRFASDTLSPAIDFVHRLETSDSFADARVERETEASPAALNAPGGNTQPRFQIEVTVLYQGSSHD